MKKFTSYKIGILILFVFTISSFTISNNSKITTDPYEMMHEVFLGSPSISQIKPLVEGILDKYDLPKNDEFRLKIGSMVLGLRKASLKGISEIQILKHIFNYGSTKISLPDQAGLSAVILEKS